MVDSVVSSTAGLHIDRNISVPSLVQAGYASGRISLPVKGAFNYALLKHVRGVPATGEQGTYTVYKLRVLDALIGRLVAARGGSSAPVDAAGASEAEIDRLIQQYRTGVDEALSNLAPSGYDKGVGVGSNEFGAVVNMFA